MIKEIDDPFDDEKFFKLNPNSRIDGDYARKEFGERKPKLVDNIMDDKVRDEI